MIRRGWPAAERQMGGDALVVGVHDGETVGVGLGDVGEAAVAAEGDGGWAPPMGMWAVT